MTKSKAEEQWELIPKYENRQPQSLRLLLRNFPGERIFSKYFGIAKKIMVKEEGWKRAIIKMNRGKNNSAVFRSIATLAKNTIELAGGASSVEQFKPTMHNEEKVYSSPWDSNAMGEYCEGNRRIFAVDVYCDGITLSSSGT